jgi:hypothetical protein
MKNKYLFLEIIRFLDPGIYLLNFKKYGNYTYGLIECSSNKRRNFPDIKNSNPTITSQDNLYLKTP